MDRRLRARALLAEAQALGVTISDLIAAARDMPADAWAVPTVAGYVDTIGRTLSAGTAATYRSYWRLAIARFGDRPLDRVGVDDCEAVVADAVARAQRERPGSDGRSSRESCVAALRALFGRAERAGLIARSPAAALTKPRRRPSRRRGLDHDELAELLDAVRTTSNDPDLDLLLIRFHLESGARREGALRMRLRDLDHRRATVWLREKDGTEREQPVSPSLLRALAQHAVDRGAVAPDDRVLRTRRAEPISRRRYNTIFDRARPCLPWADRTPVSAHVLRHTAITAVGRLAGYPAAQAFAGHSPPTVTGTYMKAPPSEVAAVVAALTGEPHPLAQRVATAAPGRPAPVGSCGVAQRPLRDTSPG